MKDPKSEKYGVEVRTKMNKRDRTREGGQGEQMGKGSGRAGWGRGSDAWCCETEEKVGPSHAFCKVTFEESLGCRICGRRDESVTLTFQPLPEPDLCAVGPAVRC